MLMVPSIEITPENVENLSDVEIDIVLNSKRAKEKIVANFASTEVTKKQELIPCSFPQHKGYAELWEKFKNSPDQQQEMKENVKITADGKIEIIKMKKKFSILTAQHNGKDVFDGSHKDKNDKTGVKWVTYLTGKAAEAECKKQNKKLLKNQSEVDQFFSFFPGETTKEKIFNFVQLFGLEKSGYWGPDDEEWGSVGSVGYAKLSEVGVNGNVYEARRDDDDAISSWNYRRFPSPFVAFEDCPA